MRITLVISSLARGGAEKVLVEMANYWAERNHKITLITLDSSKNDFFSPLPTVQRVGLDLLSSSKNILTTIRSNIHRVSKLRREIKKSQPEIVISFIDRMNVLTLLATLGLDCQTLISERTAVSVHRIGTLWSFLRKITYPLADGIVLQTQEVRDFFKTSASLPKLFIIPNPVTETKTAEENLSDVPANKKILLSVGRLTQEKGFDILLHAFSKVAPLYPDWQLLILGDGPLESSLKKLTEKLILSNQVSFLGQKKNLSAYYKKADLFALPSRYEGFPNALLEAMASGLPVVSFDCPSGPRAIIENGVNGVLVAPEDADALAESLKSLMGNEPERKRLSDSSSGVLNRFGLPNVMGLWESAIQSVRGI